MRFATNARIMYVAELIDPSPVAHVALNMSVRSPVHQRRLRIKTVTNPIRVARPL
jgi:hypothetical protein